MSKIDKDLDPSKLKSSLEEYKYGDWESVAELEDFIINFRAGSLLSGSYAEVTFLYKLPKGKKEHERKKLVVFGEADAILAGDALQALAYEIIADDNNLSNESKIRAIKLLSNACGKNGMVLGQHLDIKSESKDISQMEIENIHSLKTGKLIECAVMLGQLENISSNEKIFKSFGRNIGLAFQIIDDYLEATSSSKKLGKDINSDEKNNKSTYINIVGIDKSLERSEELAKSAIDEICLLYTSPSPRDFG